MPIYEYQCSNPKCKLVFQMFRREMDGGPGEILCPVCHEVGKKILSTVYHAKKKKGRP